MTSQIRKEAANLSKLTEILHVVADISMNQYDDNSKTLFIWTRLSNVEVESTCDKGFQMEMLLVIRF